MPTIDFGRHSDDYATFRPGPPASFYERLDRLVGLDGSTALDLGTGPGMIALELAERGCEVVGLDISPEQIVVARRSAQEKSLDDHASFTIGRSEETGFDSASFDLVTAGQCWHWFDSAGAFKEALRILRSGGHLAIIYYTYLARHSAVARDTEELILGFNPDWKMAGSSGVYAHLIDEAVHGGFRLVESFCYDTTEAFSHERWRGRMRTCHGVGSGGLTPDEVIRFDQALAKLLEKYPEPMEIEHRVWCVVGRKA